MPYRHLRPPMIEYTWEVGDETFTTVASCMDDAFERASVEAARLGLQDCPLRCIDEQPFDPTGGDGPED